jgi:hypothetical protein
MPPQNPYHPSVSPLARERPSGNRERTAASSAVTQQGLAAAGVRPHQAVLRLAASRATRSRHRGQGGREAGDVTGRVIAAALAENGATAGKPGGGSPGRTQVGVVAVLLTREPGARRGVVGDGVDLCPWREGERGHIRIGAAGVGKADQCAASAVVDVGGGVALACSTYTSPSISEITVSIDALDQCHRGGSG